MCCSSLLSLSLPVNHWSTPPQMFYYIFSVFFNCSWAAWVQQCWTRSLRRCGSMSKCCSVSHPLSGLMQTRWPRFAWLSHTCWWIKMNSHSILFVLVLEMFSGFHLRTHFLFSVFFRVKFRYHFLTTWVPLLFSTLTPSSKGTTYRSLSSTKASLKSCLNYPR